MQQVAGVAAESSATKVGGFQLDGLDQIGLLVQTLTEYLLHRAVPGCAKCEGASTGGFESATTILVAQANDALRGAQVIQNAICEEDLHERQTGRTDALGLRQAPLWIAHQVGLRIGREVIVNSRFIAALEQPRMDRDEFMIAVDALVACAVISSHRLWPIKPKGAEYEQ